MTENIIMVYGDSLSLPRIFENIPHFMTYSELLKNSLEEDFHEKFSLYNRSVGAQTIQKAQKIIQHDSAYFGKNGKNSICIIQIGVVDCAPRPISEKMKYIIDYLPECIKKKIIAFLHNKRSNLIKKNFYQYTPPR